MKLKNSLLSFFFLFSCSSSNRPYDCYQCYFSNMIESTITIPYDEINKKEIIHEDTLKDDSFFANYYVITTQSELDNFYSTNNLSISDSEKLAYSTLNANTNMTIFISQVPKGYSIYKRDNKQRTLKNGDVIFITDNFYYYVAHPEIVCCFIDLKKDDTKTNNYIYSFFYIYDEFYSLVINENNIRIIYNFIND